MATETSNHWKYQLAVKKIDATLDVFKIILMNNTFVFNKDTHATYADVSASELPTGNGYTQNAKTLTGVVVTEDDTNDRCNIAWANAQWTASGGNIGPSKGSIIIDDTTVDKTVVGFHDFGESKTAVDGGNFNIINISAQIN